MLELINDSWNLLVTLLVSCWDIINSALSLVIIDDPFWRGVEFTIVALLIWRNRKDIIALIDSIPLLGGLLARGLAIADNIAEAAVEGSLGLWRLVKANTWDRLVKLVKKTDSDLRG